LMQNQIQNQMQAQIQPVNPELLLLILRFCQKHPRLTELVAVIEPWLSQTAPLQLRECWIKLKQAPLNWGSLQNLTAEEQVLLWDSLVLLTGLVGFPDNLREVLHTWAELLGYSDLDDNISTQRQELARDNEEDPSQWVYRTLRALLAYWQTGQTPFYGFYSQRLLHLLSNQRSSSLWGYLVAVFNPPRSSSGSQDLLPDSLAPTWLAGLKSEAYAVFPHLLPAKQIHSLRQFAETTPCTPSYHDREVYDRLTGKQLVESLIFDPRNPVARRYNFTPAQIAPLPEVQALMAHPDIWAVARAYLQAEPQLVLVSLWWSSAFDGPHSRYTGQVWHIDIDRFRFLNFFVYLSDVGPDNGPHEYVRGSQGTKPLALSVDKRMEPEELLAHYEPERFAEICGPAGTVFAGDTRAFHRGRPLASDSRLMLQLDFATDRFGENCPRVPVKATDKGFERMRQICSENFYNYPAL
jgi:hypothetical protein